MIKYFLKNNEKQGVMSLALKLFRGKIEPKCALCEFAEIPDGGDVVLCRKMGAVMLPESKCRKYRYDPLKRVPRTFVFTGDFSEEDFKL